MALNICTNRYASWHLNESSGTNAPDNSGNGRNGTTVGSPSWVAGKLNNCIQLNGTSQNVDCQNIAAFERTDSFSFECWIKPDTTGGEYMIIFSKALGTSPYTGIHCYLYKTSNYLRFALYSTNVANYLQWRIDATAIMDNAWHYLVITYDGTSLITGCRCYVDGANQSKIGESDSLTGTIVNTTHFLIGQRDGALYYKGLVDEFVIYNSVLTPADVTARYNSGIGTEQCQILSKNALLGHDF